MERRMGIYICKPRQVGNVSPPVDHVADWRRSSSSAAAGTQSVSDAMELDYADTEFPQSGTFDELDPSE